MPRSLDPAAFFGAHVQPPLQRCVHPHSTEALFGGFADACARANQLELLWSVFQAVTFVGPTWHTFVEEDGAFVGRQQESMFLLV